MIARLVFSPVRRVAQVLGVALLAIAGLGSTAEAQTWPTRTVRLVVPYGTGGTPDILARALAGALQERTGQAVIVDNRAGGGGVIALETVKNAAPDGHTLVLADTGHLGVNPALRENLPYNGLKDFVPITQLSAQNFSVIVNGASEFKSLKDLVAASKASDRGLRYGSSGIGSVHHLGSEHLKQLTGGNFLHVPYKGLQFSVPALLANEVDFIVTSAAAVMSLWKSDKVRILARGSAERSALMPNVPTLRELGVPMEISINVGLLAPAGTPAPIAQKINEEIARILRSPELAKKFEGQDFTLVGGSAQDYLRLVQSEATHYRDFVKASGIKAE